MEQQAAATATKWKWEEQKRQRHGMWNREQNSLLSMQSHTKEKIDPE